MGVKGRSLRSPSLTVQGAEMDREQELVTVCKAVTAARGAAAGWR